MLSKPVLIILFVLLLNPGFLFSNVYGQNDQEIKPYRMGVMWGEGYPTNRADCNDLMDAKWQEEAGKPKTRETDADIMFGPWQSDFSESSCAISVVVFDLNSLTDVDKITSIFLTYDQINYEQNNKPEDYENEIRYEVQDRLAQCYPNNPDQNYFQKTELF